MNYKLDEWFSDEAADGAGRGDEINKREEWKEERNGEDDGHLGDDTAPPEPWQTVVPQRSQQLLAVGMRHELSEEKTVI